MTAIALIYCIMPVFLLFGGCGQSSINAESALPSIPLMLIGRHIAEKVYVHL